MIELYSPYYIHIDCMESSVDFCLEISMNQIVSLERVFGSKANQTDSHSIL